MCDVRCVMCDVPDLIFCKILTLWVKGRPKIPHLGYFRPFEWYSKIDPRWQLYIHYILQGLVKKQACCAGCRRRPFPMQLEAFFGYWWRSKLNVKIWIIFSFKVLTYNFFCFVFSSFLLLLLLLFFTFSRIISWSKVDQNCLELT